MQTPFTNHRASDLSEQVLESVSHLVDSTEDNADHQTAESLRHQPVLFHGDYTGSMEMAADRDTVAHYLDDHQSWFLRCAYPMTATPLGNNGYDLSIGHFGALGYDVEPKVGLHLLPQDHGVYRIETIEIPGYVSLGYEVDFKAALELNETSIATGQVLTQVDWTLELKVWVGFPRFIQALPQRIIQKTGDHLLSQIVRQVSKRLTHKVQADFHETLNLSFPESYCKRNHHFFERFSRSQDHCEHS
ncbi:DUF1997 domain-containing protein [Leptolyngbya iicbica]|uniref:DUF1997 domain-containing protein n=2 Tax=Cyanophyceae TaxID=3028117 RepID=A0A4Q7E8M3_9CYAN|nr:DUF1997 domain-containing protein [Leptolyngbya sp. LK]